MPPRRQPRSRTGPSTTASIRANARVTKPAKRSASDRPTKSKGRNVESPSLDSSQFQLPPVTPPQREPYTPVTPQTRKRTESQTQDRTKQQSILTPNSVVSPVELAPSTQATNAIDAQTKAESKIKYDIDEEALALPEADIKRYWKSIMDSRITPQTMYRHSTNTEMAKSTYAEFEAANRSAFGSPEARGEK
ncbi:hypothetical protein KEM54_004245 [Ascosphaera aggregata]|nr:hypothetical protein KEM54_004245 [Ascosphaera aggregata]